MIDVSRTAVGTVFGGEGASIVSCRCVLSVIPCFGAGRGATNIKRGVRDIIVGLASGAFLSDSKRFCEALIVHYFACAEEFDWISHVGIVHQTENVIVGGASLLLC